MAKWNSKASLRHSSRLPGPKKCPGGEAQKRLGFLNGAISLRDEIFTDRSTQMLQGGPLPVSNGVTGPLETGAIPPIGVITLLIPGRGPTLYLVLYFTGALGVSHIFRPHEAAYMKIEFNEYQIGRLPFRL